MVCYFAGGAIGSAVGSSVYETHRWAGVCVVGAVIGVVATVAAVVDGIRRPAVAASGRAA
jgi:predicted MFS family arabinose efflux permease